MATFCVADVVAVVAAAYVFLRARPFSLSSALAKGSEQHFSCLSLASHASLALMQGVSLEAEPALWRLCLA